MDTGLLREDCALDPERRAWSEYLAWTRGSCPEQYRLTEERAWERLQLALLAVRVDVAHSDGGSTPREQDLQREGDPLSRSDVVGFEPDDGFPGFFTPL